MVTFSSRSAKLKVWGEKIVNGKNVGERLASFEPLGKFKTDDETLIEKLRNHGAFNRDFVEANMTVLKKDNLIQGVRSAGNRPVLGEREKLIRFGVLQTKLLKLSGDYRLDATPEDIKELKTIQEELGV